MDLATYINFTEFTTLHESTAIRNAASEPNSFPWHKPDLSATRFKEPYHLKEVLLDLASVRLAGHADTVAFTHHMDGYRNSIYGSGLGHKDTILLNTEYALLRSSHNFKLTGCPVSSALRRERHYHPNKTWVPAPGDPSAHAPFLELEPCRCDRSFSAMC
jgi:hypothetical protein